MLTHWKDRVRRADKRRRLTSSSRTDGVVDQAPADLLVAARAALGDDELHLETYTLARVIASEEFTATPEEWACLGDADLNRAARRGLSVFDHVTGKTGLYGEQRGARKVASSRDPAEVHVVVARALLSGEARGIARGAYRYFDPAAQLAVWRRREGAAKPAPPLVVLERWCYDKAFVRGTDQELVGGNERRPWLSGVGDDLEEWVGPIAGVDAYNLMLFRKADAGADHNRRYLEARQVIRSKNGAANPLDFPEVPLFALMAIGVAMGGAV